MADSDRGHLLINLLTGSRLVFAAAVAALVPWAAEGTWAILVATALVGAVELSDLLDGHLARRHNVVSEFGKVFDPYADSVSRLTVYWALAMMGFNVLSVANNHILDHGADAARDTMRRLEDNGIDCVGLDTNLSQNHTPLVFNCDETRAAFLAYCLIPSVHSNLVVTDTDRICEDVSLAKKEVDFVIVSLHWGSEYMNKPSPSQIDLAHRIIDSGASLILGHHPHVLQGIERYNEGVIAYSLGNFMFDMEFVEESREGLILTCILSKEGAAHFELVPTTVEEDRIPRLLTGDEKDGALGRLSILASELDKRDSRGFDVRQAAYSHMAERERDSARRRARIHFLRNLLKYNPLFSARIVLNYIANRLRR